MPQFQARARDCFKAALTLLFCCGGFSGASAQGLQSRNQGVTNAAGQAPAIPQQASPLNQGLSPDAISALQRQLSLQSRNQLAIEAMRAAQAAARGAALTDPNNNIKDALGNVIRDAAGKPLNGLGVGALNPAVTQSNYDAGKTKVDTAASQVGVWQGAKLPVAGKKPDGSAGTANDVVIEQTEERSILSWSTFNVGRDTTLTYKPTAQLEDAGVKGWVALNRIVGGVDSNGRRTPGLSPSQILGTIQTADAKGDVSKGTGTILILNQNGILFGPSSQINVNALIATTSEIGRGFSTARDPNPAPGKNPTLYIPANLLDRNTEFRQYGLLGVKEAVGGNSFSPYFDTVGVDKTKFPIVDPTYPAGGIRAEAGAQISAGKGGFAILNAPRVENAGTIYAPDADVTLLGTASGFDLKSYDGTAAGGNANIRGVIAQISTGTYQGDVPLALAKDFALDPALLYSRNSGLIDAPRGAILLNSNEAGGILRATTSVSRNGYISVDRTLANSTIAITPDDAQEAIPQDAASLAAFKTSQINIGYYIGENALVLAPGGNVTLGDRAAIGNGSTTLGSGSFNVTRLTIETGATIDVSGLKDVLLPASRNSIKIGPLKGNELAESPDYRFSFLNGATVYIDPRLRGVRSDGVAWVGSPLINAAAVASQVTVGVSELLTKGGSVTIAGRAAPYNTPALSDGTRASFSDTIVKQGAAIDISGGWTRYAAGTVLTTRLRGADGREYDISEADPLKTRFVGFANGFTVNHSRFGITETYSSLSGNNSPLFVDSYIEGRDAGILQLTGSVTAFDGGLYGQAYAGERQRSLGKAGTATGQVSWDRRALQASAAELPSGGALRIGVTPIKPAFGEAVPVPGNLSIVKEGTIVPVSPSLSYGRDFGSVDRDRLYTKFSQNGPALPSRSADALLPLDRIETIQLSDALLSKSGLSEFSSELGGKVTVAAGADVRLQPGGVFDVTGGRAITVNGSITVPSGKILLTTKAPASSPLNAAPLDVGSLDVTVNGSISVRGLWTNDYQRSGTAIQGAAYLDGGQIKLQGADRVFATVDGKLGNIYNRDEAIKDISGSVLVNAGATLDLSSGGYVDTAGKLNLTAKGGSLSLINPTIYTSVTGFGNGPGDAPSQRNFLNVDKENGLIYYPLPDKITARVAIDPGATVRSAGFGGGGTFELITPAFSFGNGVVDMGTQLPMDFINNQGFQNYKITSYKMNFLKNDFYGAFPNLPPNENSFTTRPIGGYDAFLATQTLTIGSGQTFLLRNQVLPRFLDGAAAERLRGLSSGGDVLGIVRPTNLADTPAQNNAYYRQPVNLSLGGLIELKVAAGGQILGEAGATLTVPKLINEGTIRLPGGSIIQQETPPGSRPLPLGITTSEQLRSLLNPDTSGPFTGLFNQGLASKVAGFSNASLVFNSYFLGELPAEVGVKLAAGSVTDISGISLRDPLAQSLQGGAVVPLQTGRILDGGSLVLTPDALKGGGLYNIANPGRRLVADAGAVIDLRGASDAYDLPSVSSGVLNANGNGYVRTPVWSAGGRLSAPNGFTLTGADIKAGGGAREAAGGSLELGGEISLGYDRFGGKTLASSLGTPVLAQTDPSTAQANVISAAQIEASGFDTLTLRGGFTTQGDVNLTLGRSLTVSARPVFDSGISPADPNGINIDPSYRDYYPRIDVGGSVRIDAAYIRLESLLDRLLPSGLTAGTPPANRLTLAAGAIDVAGAVQFGASIGETRLESTGDIRLIGIPPYIAAGDTTTNGQSLRGQIAAANNLTLAASRVYPTTGSDFLINSSSPTGTIAFAPPPGGVLRRDVPYSAGASLSVQAANIVQGGALFVPHGALNLGTLNATAFAPATQSLTFADGSLTSVSGGTISIPYGATTDRKEWFFAPTKPNALTAPPAKTVALAAARIGVGQGATIDLSGGGDVFAYEFVPGTGGSRDVLNQVNPDPFTATKGNLYPDGRQVYAIVPGLSDATVAAYDPLFSANYGDLGAASGAGHRVFLDGVQGLAAAWYTLLPAQYAVLPGGFRVVERTGATAVPGAPSGALFDGTQVVTGRFGQLATEESRVRLFDVQSQDVFRKYSNIALTSANTEFTRRAENAKTIPPRLPRDAGQIGIAALNAFDVQGKVLTAPAAGGRGAIADISGSAIYITAVSGPQTTIVDGTVLADGSFVRSIGGALRLCASAAAACTDGLSGRLSDNAPILIGASTLTALNAESLLIGGGREFQTDGSVLVKTSAQRVVIANDASAPLTGPEILLAAGFSQNGVTKNQFGGDVLSDVRTSGQARSIALLQGAVIEAAGTLTDTSTTDYIAAGGSSSVTFVQNPNPNLGNTVVPNRITAGTFLRVANGPDRFIRRDGIGGNADLAGLSPLPSNDTLANRYSVDLSIANGATVKGTSILADVGTYRNPDLAWKPSQTLSIGAGAIVTTKSLALSAGQVAFANTAPSGFNGLLVTDGLASQFSGADRLTIASNAAIAFAGGPRTFGDIRLLTPGITSLSGDVEITATRFELGNRSVIPPACVAACGTGKLSITAAGGTVNVTGADGKVTPQIIPAEILLGSGSVATSFGGGVTLNAAGGIYAIDGDGGLAAGTGALTLDTPIVADRARAGAAQPRVSFTSSGAIAIAGTAGFDIAKLGGFPGAAVTFDGGSISVSGTRLRATAGSVQLIAQTGDVRVTNGAIVEAPGYDQVFGTLDPVTKAAPGGRVRLEARQGSLFADASTTLSVGRGKGTAGTLELIAPASSSLDGILATLDGKAREGAAGLTIDLGGAFDFTGFAAKASGLGFTGALDIKTRGGDLTLAANETLRAQSVKLTADGGLTDILGIIDTSGTRGGAISLFGRYGVALRSSAKLIASATGYGYDAAKGAWRNDDSRVAQGGDVTLGTDGAGAITVAAGAVIDVRALQTEARIGRGLTGDRLVPVLRNGLENYLYAAADRGGALTLRAPVSGPDGANTVNIAVADAASVVGARDVVLEGFKRFDLGQIAAIANSGATLNAGTNTVSIDPTGAYFSSATQAGGIVPFIQKFRLSQASRDALGGLASKANYRETPGVDLAYEGNITLTRNWNLGAGTVDIAAAKAAGLIRVTDTDVVSEPSDYVVVERQDLSPAAIEALQADLGKTLAQTTDLEVKDWVQSSLFSRYTDLLYRVRDPRGSAYGQAPKLSFRAGGNLTVNGSISDGFFSFREQSSDLYQGAVAPIQPSGTGTDDGQPFTGNNGNFIPGIVPTYIPFVIPYEAASNSVSPLSNSTTSRDPFGSMELFPRLIQANAPAGLSAVSSSFNLLAGADVSRSGGRFTASSDPAAIRSNTAANLTVTGTYSYDLSGSVLTSNRPGGKASVSPVIRTGSGSIGLEASGTVDLVGAPSPFLEFGRNVGGARVYTAGVRTATGPRQVSDPIGRLTALDTSAYIPTFTNFSRISLDRGYYFEIESGLFQSFYPTLPRNGPVADPVFTSGGGSISAFAGGDIRSVRDFSVTPLGSGVAFFESQRRFIGQLNQLWRVGVRSSDATARINPQQFFDGIGTLGGGDITVNAGGSVVDLSAIATTSLLNANTTTPSGSATRALITFGGGDVTIAAKNDILGGKFDVASGSGTFMAGRDLAPARRSSALVGQTTPIFSEIRLADATATFNAGRNLTLGGVSGLGVARFDGDISDATAFAKGGGSGTRRIGDSLLNQLGFYTPAAALKLSANGSLTIVNTILSRPRGDFNPTTIADYPGTFSATVFTGGITFNPPVTVGSSTSSIGTNRIVQVPNASGGLELLAAGDISPFTLSMDDGDPATVPGILSNYPTFQIFQQTFATRALDFPDYSPDALESLKRLQHAQTPTHSGDEIPARVYAGGNITGAIVSLPKQARIEAGRDIVDMVFFGQNLTTGDITSIVAGQDITATTQAISQTDGQGGSLGQAKPTVFGNSFTIGGEGRFLLQAGRDAGPFLTSALPTNYTSDTNTPVTPVNPYGGGVQSVGNGLNPFLRPAGAAVSVRFGVGKGIAWDGFREAYFNPANLSKLSGDFVVGATANNGIIDVTTGQAPTAVSVTPSNYIYATQLLAWVKANASKELAQQGVSADTLTYAQAYAVFAGLPILRQQFFLQEIYFQELIATAEPKGPSYLKYARGYSAVNVLFPAKQDADGNEIGYTRNALSGGANGASTLVQTGDLDLRLATIQTAQGGDIRIMGPGGRVIAGSLVRTDQQAARRNFEGVPLYKGAQFPYPVTGIARIPSQYEGVITVKGGSLYSFTDGDFLLNQSRAFTVGGGNLALWSSNADLNAGQGPKTSANFPPLVVKCNYSGYCSEDRVAATTGAGIAALKPAAGIEPPDVFLIAPRGTVDAGDAGVRVAGNLSIAARFVKNADNIQVGGTVTGVPLATTVDTGALTTAGNTVAAATNDAAPPKRSSDKSSIIIVEIIGFGGGDGTAPGTDCPDGKPRTSGKCPDKVQTLRSQGASLTTQDANNPVQVIGGGTLTPEQSALLTPEERANFAAN